MSKIFNCSQQNISAIENGIKKFLKKIRILQTIMTMEDFENLLKSINYYNSSKIVQEIILKKINPK